MKERGNLLQNRVLHERGRARKIAVVLTAPLFVVPALVLYGTIQVLSQERGNGGWFGGLLFGTSITLIFFFAARWTFRFLSSRLAPPRAQVMWLRRFQAEGRGVFRTSRVIDQLARYGLSAITLQDRDVRYSWEQQLNRLAPVFWLLLIPVALVLLGFFYQTFPRVMTEAVESAFRSQDTSSLAGIFGAVIAAFVIGIVVGTLILAVLFLVAILALYIIFSTTLLAGPIRRFLSRNRDDFPKLPKLLRRITRGKHPRGALVIRIGDANWRDAVRSTLQVVDAVIIDITQITDAIAWEVTEALAVRGPGATVFIAREDAVIDPVVSAQTRMMIRRELGRDISDVSPIRYPARRNASRRERLRFASELREALYAAAEAPQPNGIAGRLGKI